MVWLERFVLAILALVFWNWVMNNGRHLDGHFRIALGFVLLGLSYGVGHIVYLETRKPAAPHSHAAPAVETLPKDSSSSGAASTAGDQSPAVTGDGNTVSYGSPPAAPKKDQK